MGIVEFLKNALFPKTCMGCNKLGTYLCPDCAKALKPVTSDKCPYCDRASYFGLTHPSCKKLSRLDGLKSFYYYSPVARKIVKNIKYRLVHEAIHDFLTAIPPAVLKPLFFYKKISGKTYFLPVPLHPKRQAVRGFNQSYEFACFFSEKTGIPVTETIIKRIKNTRPQAQLKTHEARYHNIQGAFALDKNSALIRHANFIIVDDVWTSGSTIKELARVLKKHHAASVFALTLVR